MTNYTNLSETFLIIGLTLLLGIVGGLLFIKYFEWKEKNIFWVYNEKEVLYG